MNDNERNGLQEIIDKAISDIARTEGDSFELDKMNLAEERGSRDRGPAH